MVVFVRVFCQLAMKFVSCRQLVWSVFKLCLNAQNKTCNITNCSRIVFVRAICLQLMKTKKKRPAAINLETQHNNTLSNP